MRHCLRLVNESRLMNAQCAVTFIEICFFQINTFLLWFGGREWNKTSSRTAHALTTEPYWRQPGWCLPFWALLFDWWHHRLRQCRSGSSSPQTNKTKHKKKNVKPENQTQKRTKRLDRPFQSISIKNQLNMLQSMTFTDRLPPHMCLAF